MRTNLITSEVHIHGCIFKVPKPGTLSADHTMKVQKHHDPGETALPDPYDQGRRRRLEDADKRPPMRGTREWLVGQAKTMHLAQVYQRVRSMPASMSEH